MAIKKKKENQKKERTAMLKLKESNENYVNFENMKDGDIAVIRKWRQEDGYIGYIVQRHEYSLITLGGTYGKSFPNIFKHVPLDDCLVEILPKGSEFILE